MLSKITNSTVVPNIEQAILGLNMDQYKHEHRCIVTQVLLAARMESIYRWKSIDVPTIKDIKIKINTITEYEKIMAYREGNFSRFESNWSPWKLLLSSNYLF